MTDHPRLTWRHVPADEPELEDDAWELLADGVETHISVQVYQDRTAGVNEYYYNAKGELDSMATLATCDTVALAVSWAEGEYRERREQDMEDHGS